MVKTKLKATLCVLLAAVMLFCPLCALASETEDDTVISPRFAVIDSVSGWIQISGITANCYAEMTTKSSVSMSITMELQKYSSGAYATVQTWNASGTGRSLSDSESKTINILYDYRLKITYKAGTETSVDYKYP